MNEDESIDIYISDPRAKTIEGFIEGLKIFAKYTEKGYAEPYFFGAHHDEIHIYVDQEKLPKNSEDGKTLISLGFHSDDDTECWSYFT